MEFFLVGGAVRDKLLGIEVNDEDFVVVGGTPEEMEKMGFKQVGADFPVFLNTAGEEFALARTERKSGTGYNGFETTFDPSVTLEDDLFRRDLTINAMARDFNTDELVDPFGGRNDLNDGVLRHVSEHFAEDPVRVLRVARFAARLGFSIAPETMELMKQLVQSGELDSLTPERVWKETEKALMCDHPSEFFHVLKTCGASEVLFPELKRNIIFTGLALNRTAMWELPLEQRLMTVFLESSPEEAQALLERLKAPASAIKMVVKFCRMVRFLRSKGSTPSAESVLEALNAVDAWRSAETVRQMTIVVAASLNTILISKMDIVVRSLFEAQKVRFATLPQELRDTLKGKAVGDAISNRRLEVIRSITNL